MYALKYKLVIKALRRYDLERTMPLTMKECYIPDTFFVTRYVY
jgi:hypothetical protein